MVLQTSMVNFARLGKVPSVVGCSSGTAMPLKDGKAAQGAGSSVSFWRDRGGATAIEYSLLASLIAIAIIVAAATLGVSLHDLFVMFGGLDAWNSQP